MKIVETLKKTYLAREVTGFQDTGGALSLDRGTSVTLKGAMLIDTAADPDEIAREYVRGELLGKVADVTAMSANIESISDAGEIGPLVGVLQQHVPIAERKARARNVLRELRGLMGDDGDEDVSKARRAQRKDTRDDIG